MKGPKLLVDVTFFIKTRLGVNFRGLVGLEVCMLGLRLKGSGFETSFNKCHQHEPIRSELQQAIVASTVAEG